MFDETRLWPINTKLHWNIPAQGWHRPATTCPIFHQTRCRDPHVPRSPRKRIDRSNQPSRECSSQRTCGQRATFFDPTYPGPLEFVLGHVSRFAYVCMKLARIV